MTSDRPTQMLPPPPSPDQLADPRALALSSALRRRAGELSSLASYVLRLPPSEELARAESAEEEIAHHADRIALACGLTRRAS